MLTHEFYTPNPSVYFVVIDVLRNIHIDTLERMMYEPVPLGNAKYCPSN